MENWVMSFLLSSFIMTAIILIIMLCNKLFFRAYPAKQRYIIWILILIGLIVPFRPAIGDGLISIQIPGFAQTQSKSTEMQMASESAADTESTQHDTSFEKADNPLAEVSVSAVTICIWIWGIITAVMFFYHILSYAKFTRMIRRWGIPVEEGQVLSVFQTVQENLGVSGKRIELKKCDFVNSSMLTGFFHPVILLPDKHFDEDELELIFKHELIHFKRHDLYVKLLIVIATCIHWFNPVVHWMCKVMQIDGESYCDAAVLQNTNIEDRQFYGEVIIGMIGDKSNVKTILSTNFYAGKSNIKKRLDSIMDTKQKKSRFAIAQVALVGLMTLFSGSVFAFSDAPSSETTVETTPISSAAVDAEVTDTKATKAALAKVGGGDVSKCEIDYEDGRKVYDITIIYENNQYEMYVDAGTGVITNYQVKTISSDPSSHSNDDGDEDDHDNDVDEDD